ncbi:hypothetical protein Btru_041203 [Bulinus truncatus]|nr:hypothetical protein Btru_041203 [Bulinus truncatus]
MIATRDLSLRRSVLNCELVTPYLVWVHLVVSAVVSAVVSTVVSAIFGEVVSASSQHSGQCGSRCSFGEVVRAVFGEVFSAVVSASGQCNGVQCDGQRKWSVQFLEEVVSAVVVEVVSSVRWSVQVVSAAVGAHDNANISGDPSHPEVKQSCGQAVLWSSSPVVKQSCGQAVQWSSQFAVVNTTTSINTTTAKKKKILMKPQKTWDTHGQQP